MDRVNNFGKRLCFWTFYILSCLLRLLIYVYLFLEQKVGRYYETVIKYFSTALRVPSILGENNAQELRNRRDFDAVT